MRRVLQLCLLYAAAFGCALLVGCAQPAPGAVIEAEALTKLLKQTWPGFVPLVRLDDRRYELADFDSLESAARRSHRNWIPESWDCDDQTASALHRLRVGRYGAVLPLAVGRVTGRIGDYEHAVLWCAEAGTGRVRLFDATFLHELLAGDIQAREASDH